MVAFAGERVLELEAPIRNDATKETLLGWGRTQDEVEGGRCLLEPSMVRECFEYLFSKVRGEGEGEGKSARRRGSGMTAKQAGSIEQRETTKDEPKDEWREGEGREWERAITGTGTVVVGGC